MCRYGKVWHLHFSSNIDRLLSKIMTNSIAKLSVHFVNVLGDPSSDCSMFYDIFLILRGVLLKFQINII